MDERDFLRRFVSEQRVQTNEVQRCWALLPCFLEAARRLGAQTIDLIELGTSAGLLLFWDRYRYGYDEGEWGPPHAPLQLGGEERGRVPAGLLTRELEVREHVGIDLEPVDVTRDEDALLLKSFVWADRTERIERLERAIAALREHPPEIVQGDFVELLPGLLERRRPDALTVVMQVAAGGYLDEEGWERLHAALDAGGLHGPACLCLRGPSGADEPPALGAVADDVAGRRADAARVRGLPWKLAGLGVITSASNPRLKLIKRLQSRRQRERLGLFVCEGEDLVDAGRSAGAKPVDLLVAGEDVEPDLLAQISTLAHPARVVAVFRRADLPRPSAEALGLALWRVADPGNVGTLIRTAHAFRAGIFLSAGCADPTGPKALRASMGSIFRVPTGRFDEAPGPKIALVPRGGTPLEELELEDAATFVLGAERDGVPDDVAAACAARATIRTAGEAESLNVAAAGADRALRSTSSTTRPRRRQWLIGRCSSGSASPFAVASRRRRKCSAKRCLCGASCRVGESWRA